MFEAWYDKKFEKVENEIEKRNEIDLKEAVKNAKLASVCILAIRRIFDQDFLFEQAKTHRDYSVRKEAFKNMNDSFLFEFSVTSIESDLVLEALKKIKDLNYIIKFFNSNTKIEKDEVIDYVIGNIPEQLRCTLVLKLNNEILQEKILFYITDEKYLLKITLATNNLNIAESASKKIFTGNFLRDIVLECNFDSIKENALNKIIHDQNLLKDIVLSNIDKGLKINSLKKINDPLILVEILNKTSDNEFINIAKASVYDPKILLYKDLNDDLAINILLGDVNKNEFIEIFKRTESRNVQLKVLENLENLDDEKELYELLLNEKNEEIANLLIKNINNEEYLYQIVKLGIESIALKALEKIENKDIIIKIASGCMKENIKREAIKKIDDYDTLLKLLEIETDDEHRLDIIRSLNKMGMELDKELEDMLTNIAIKSKNNNILLEIIKLVNNFDNLCKISFNMKDDNVYREIFRKIRNIRDKEILADNEKNILNIFKNIILGTNDRKMQLNILKQLQKYENNDKVLFEIVQSGEDLIVANESVKYINSEKYLHKLFETNDSKYIRFAIVDELEDLQKLKEIVDDEKELPIVIKAVNKINDEEILEDIVISDKPLKARLLATEKIEDLDILEKLSKKIDNSQILNIISKKLKIHQSFLT